MSAFVRALIDEARRIARDPGALLILVVALALYAGFYPLPYLEQVAKDLPVAVVDLDHSALSRQLVRMLDAHELLRVVPSATPVEAQDSVRTGRAHAVLLIPPDLERKVVRGERASVAAYVDASYILLYRQTLTGLFETTATLSGQVKVRQLAQTGMTPAQAVAGSQPVALVSRALYNPTEGYGNYVVPAVLVLILQQTLLVGIGLVGGTAREKGRMPRGGVSDLLGRTTAYLLLYSVHAFAYFEIVYRAYGFPQRAAALSLAAVALPFLLSVVLLGLALRTCFAERETAIQVLLFTSLPAIFLAGFSWPTEALPAWLRTGATLLPSTSAIPAFLRLTQMGATLADVRHEYLTLWALTAAYLVAAFMVTRFRFGRRLAGGP